MNGSFILQYSSNKIRKSTYQNEYFFACHYEPDDDQSESVDIYTKPLHPGIKPVCSIVISEDEGYVRHVHISGKHCIIITDYLKVYDILENRQVNHTLISFIHVHVCFVHNQRLILFVRDTQGNSTIVSQNFSFQTSNQLLEDSHSIFIQEFVNDPVIDDKTDHYIQKNDNVGGTRSWFSNNLLSTQSYMYKGLLVILRPDTVASENATFTSHVFKLDDNVFKQVCSFRNKIFCVEDKIISWCSFHGSSIMYIVDIQTFDIIYKLNTLNIFSDYSVSYNSLNEDDDFVRREIPIFLSVSYKNILRNDPQKIISIKSLSPHSNGWQNKLVFFYRFDWKHYPWSTSRPINIARPNDDCLHRTVYRTCKKRVLGS